MAFQGNKTRKIKHPELDNSAQVFPISVELMTISDGNSRVHFQRLGYRGCPGITAGRNKKVNFKKYARLHDMNRWDFVSEMYQLISTIERSTRTKINIFNDLVYLVKVCDKNNIVDCFSIEAIRSLVSALKKNYFEGTKGKTLRRNQYSIKAIILEKNIPNYKELLKIFQKFPADSIPVEPYTDNEVKVIVKNLYTVVSDYKKHLLEGTVPVCFPLYDEEKLISKGYEIRYLRSAWSKKVASANNVDAWKLDLVRAAYYLVCFFTGINTSQLKNLKVSDVTEMKFIESSRGKFILSTLKNRQNGRINLDEVGFTKRAKEFFELWLLLIKIISPSENTYLFPKIVNGVCKKQDGASLYNGLNASFKTLGLPILVNQRFRKTKASLILRVTESIFSVAEGLNNSPETVSKSYSDGDPVVSRFTLAAMLDVRERTARGESIANAIENSVFGYKDPVREIYFKTISNNIPTKVPNGLRCKEPFGEKAKRLKESLVESNLANQDDAVSCHKFLECFGCEYHAVIAEVEDVWLMLSFRDVILEVMSAPSINSNPGELLKKINNTTESILNRIKRDFSDIYLSAMQRYLDEPHPLWADKDDFELLKEFW